jgi:exodeoxyribonuclease VII large subunit
MDSARLHFARTLRAPAVGIAKLQRLHERLLRAGRDRAALPAQRLASLASNLAHLNPTAVLDRGYAIVTTRAGDIVTDSERLAPGDYVTLKLGRGEADATIRSRR